MAGTYDSENQRIIDRIKCIAFREASDAGATLITRKRIANKLHRSENWVRRHWNNSPEECFAEFHGGRCHMSKCPAGHFDIYQCVRDHDKMSRQQSLCRHDLSGVLMCGKFLTYDKAFANLFARFVYAKVTTAKIPTHAWTYILFLHIPTRSSQIVNS